jgi:hypothetical protein
MPDISPVHIWRATTGGGLPVDYLRWLSAMFEQFRYATPEGRHLAARLDHAGVTPAHIASYLRAPFNDWLVARFTTTAIKD